MQCVGWIRVAAILAMSFAAHCATAATTSLRIGYQKSSVTLALARHNGDIEKFFPGVNVKWAEFPSGPPLLEALGAGRLDLGMTGDAPPVFAQANASPIVYIGVEPPKPESSGILVRADGNVAGLSTLKGKRVAFQVGSSAHFLVLSALASANLKYSDITPVQLSPADARAAFSRGDVDAWAIWDPYFASAERSVPNRVLTTGKGLSDNNSFYLASRAFATTEPTAVDTFLAALNAARQFRNDHAEETVHIVSTSTGLDDATSAIFVARNPKGPVTPLTPEVVAGQQRVADAFFAAGLIPRAVHVDDIVWPKTAATKTSPKD